MFWTPCQVASETSPSARPPKLVANNGGRPHRSTSQQSAIAHHGLKKWLENSKHSNRNRNHTNNSSESKNKTNDNNGNTSNSSNNSDSSIDVNIVV